MFWSYFFFPVSFTDCLSFSCSSRITQFLTSPPWADLASSSGRRPPLPWLRSAAFGRTRPDFPTQMMGLPAPPPARPSSNQARTLCTPDPPGVHAGTCFWPRVLVANPVLASDFTLSCHPDLLSLQCLTRKHFSNVPALLLLVLSASCLSEITERFLIYDPMSRNARTAGALGSAVVSGSRQRRLPGPPPAGSAPVHASAPSLERRCPCTQRSETTFSSFFSNWIGHSFSHFGGRHPWGSLCLTRYHLWRDRMTKNGASKHRWDKLHFGPMHSRDVLMFGDIRCI